MNKKIKLLLSTAFSVISFAYTGYSQSKSSVVSGDILDKQTKAPLELAVIGIKGTDLSTVSDSVGHFSLRGNIEYPATVVFQYLGYRKREIPVSQPTDALFVELTNNDIISHEVVVSASRQAEKILESPVAIEKMDMNYIKQTPAPSFYDALENVKGVQLTTASLTFKVPNTRGFNSPNNFRFMQLVDGVDVQSATLGVPLGNAIGPTDLDVRSVEITPGASSALYGMNAINGMASITTKDPFTYQGLSVYQKLGVNHVDGRDHDPALLTESAIRYAKAWNKFGFKVNASYMKGTDWLSTNTTDQNLWSSAGGNPSFPDLQNNNPAYDAWNKYGDETNNNVPVSVFYNGKDQTFNIRRTGYWENDIRSTDVKNIKADATLAYKINSNTQLSYTYRYGLLDGVFQRGNKIQLRDATVQNHKLELSTPRLLLRGYLSVENTGNSYNMKPMADNLDLNNGSNTAWGTKFQTALQTAINNGTALDEAMDIARTVADAGRVEPGTPQFDSLLNVIASINNWDIAANVPGAPATGGAWLKQMSRTWHAEGQYKLADEIRFADILVGADYRLFEVIPDGNNFVDFSKPLAERNQEGGNNLYYGKVGVWGQLTKKLMQDKLKFVASLRYDKNPNFKGTLNPRIALVYDGNKNHYFRVSYQNGYRYPSLFEALSFVNNGNVRRVGGLTDAERGLGYLANSYTLASVTKYTAAVNADVANGVNRTQAALNNKGLLEIANLKAAEPERINSYEIGYKGFFFNKRLYLDVDVYYNVYDGFLGQVEVAVPTSGDVGTDEAALDMLARANQSRYRVYTNSKNQYKNYGIGLGLTYNLGRGYQVSGNANYNEMQSNETADIFVIGFNTPSWITNLSFSNRELFKNLGYNILWKYQSTFDWQSPLANGRIPGYHTLDLQVTYQMPKINSSLKIGGTNVLNNRYYQYAAGPTIGGLYYLSYTIDGLLQAKK